MKNEEIKEILERSKNLKNKCSCCEQVGKNVYISRYHEIQTQNLAEAVYLIDKLLDYITNLQQKLEQYEKTQTYGDYVETVNKVVELQQENEILKELNVCVGCENNPDYKLRCEKAIEILKLLLDDLKLNSKKEKEEGRSYFNTVLFAIRVKEILETLKRG